ncbi:MAG: T9SS type A sorting domain-containing protein [Ignavibacteria bacterium]|nr:T9SS type A sorting domain-containing protein [Ignavibacteria bacterium]
MEKYLKIVISLFILALFNCNAFSQGLNAIVAPDESNIVAVGDNGKILRSSNGGNTWSRTTNGSVNYKSAAFIGNDVWVGGSDGKVYKTTKVNTGLVGYLTGSVNSVNGVDFVTSTVGYACGDGGTVYRTSDGGLTWTLKNTGLPNVKFNCVSFRDAAVGVIGGNNGTAYVTTNSGDSWTAFTTGTTRNILAAHYYPTIIYFVGEWGTILTTTGSPTLTSVKSRTRTDVRAISGISSSEVHLAGGGGFIRNNKNSSTEFLNFEINPMMANLVGIAFTDANTGFAISSLNDAIIKTTNGGVNWNLTAGATMQISWVSKLTGSGGIGNNLTFHPTNRDMLYVVYGKTMYRSYNKGETWSSFGTVGATSGTVTAAHSFYMSPLDTNILMCAIEGSPTDKVVRSTNYGATWTTILTINFSNYGMPLEMDQNDPNLWYYAPDGGGFWKSTNNGANFTEISGAYPFRSPCDIVVEWEDSRNIMIADGVTSASQPAEIFRSTNGGVNWTKVHTNSGGSGLSEIPSMCNSAFDPKLGYATNWSGSNRYKTTNSGVNWFAIQSTPWSGWNSDISREDPTVVLTGNYGTGSSLSTDAGTSWTVYTMPSGGCGAGMIVPGREYLVSMQCSGLLKMNITYNVITNINEQTLPGLPTKYDLAQNYPNPFNPSTEIRYDILNTGFVSMKVYDQAGKEVYTLVNGMKNAGTYSVKFDASSLSSGVYYYTLETAGNTFTKKMILVK